MAKSNRSVPSIFLSHSHEDNGFCRPFVGHLKSRLGITDSNQIFYDESSMHLGDDWFTRIQVEIVSRPIFMAVLTPKSVAADYVRQETNLALRETVKHKERRIYSLMVERCDPNQLSPLLPGYHLADFCLKGYDVAFEELIAALNGDVSGSPTPSTQGQISTSVKGEKLPRALELADEAHLALRAGKYADAVLKAEFALSLAENETNATLHADIALAYAAEHRWSEARDAAERALRLDGFRADVWRVLGQSERMLGHPGEALSALDRARALAPLDDETTRVEIVRDRRAVYFEQRQWHGVLKTLDEERAMVPESPSLQALRADVLERVGREQDALQLLRELTVGSEATIAMWLARARLARNVDQDLVEAESAVEAAAKLDPTSPAIAQARRELSSQVQSQRFPRRLVDLGFESRTAGDREAYVPPVLEIAGGEFLMGSYLQLDREAYENEFPRHSVLLPLFNIARFPVTVAEYACFVRDGGAEPKPCEVRGRTIDWKTQLQRVDHSVVGVDWHDCLAYTNWLAGITNQHWRLPTEAEWEKAARWDSDTRYSRIYPWGDTFDNNLCNTNASGIGTTTPVGAYPGGASIYGVEDMAGNVWEWTSSLFKPYPYGASEEDLLSTGNRVMRGGSWNFIPRDARSADRDVDSPSLHTADLGFRICFGDGET